MKHIVYIAGPYTQGDQFINVRNTIVAGQEVYDAGGIPVLPLMAAFWHLIIPGPYEQWMEIDLALLERCDAMIRLPGDSPGADREAMFAAERGIPVYDSVEAWISKED